MDGDRTTWPIASTSRPPGPYDDFTYRPALPTFPATSTYAFTSMQPRDAPRLTPPPQPSSIFATSEEASLASFLDDFEDSAEFLFQPTLPEGMPDYGSLFADDNSFTFDPSASQVDRPELTPKAIDPLAMSSYMAADHPSAKRFRSEDGSSQRSPTLPLPSPALTNGPHNGLTRSTRSTRNVKPVITSSGPASPASSHSTPDVKPIIPQAPNKKPLLTEQEKRNNHIQSEQKRRDAIRNGFVDLVQLLQAGESVSGLSIGADDADGKRPKGRGRGRGRKGDGTNGAAKSVVLSQACRYVQWLEHGNGALEVEVMRLEALTGMS